MQVSTPKAREQGRIKICEPVRNHNVLNNLILHIQIQYIDVYCKKYLKIYLYYKIIIFIQYYNLFTKKFILIFYL